MRDQVQWLLYLITYLCFVGLLFSAFYPSSQRDSEEIAAPALSYLILVFMWGCQNVPPCKALVNSGKRDYSLPPSHPQIGLPRCQLPRYPFYQGMDIAVRSPLWGHALLGTSLHRGGRDFDPGLPSGVTPAAPSPLPLPTHRGRRRVWESRRRGSEGTSTGEGARSLLGVLPGARGRKRQDRKSVV